MINFYAFILEFLFWLVVFKVCPVFKTFIAPKLILALFNFFCKASNPLVQVPSIGVSKSIFLLFLLSFTEIGTPSIEPDIDKVSSSILSILPPKASENIFATYLLSSCWVWYSWNCLNKFCLKLSICLSVFGLSGFAFIEFLNNSTLWIIPSFKISL